MGFALGLASNALDELSAAGLSAPRFIYSPHTKIVGQNGMGMPVPMGPPTLTWRWDFLSLEQWTWLLDWLDGGSSRQLYVRSVTEETNDDSDDIAFAVWQAYMWRPTSRMRGRVRVDVEVKFTWLDLVE